MILFGHLGFTLTFFRLSEKAKRRNVFDNGSEFDYRYVFVGSVLPDLIDKPLIFLLSGSLHSGRVIAHTLLFSLLLFSLGLLYYRTRSNSSILALAGGCFAHLVLDGMWNYPSILFWPVYGVALSGVYSLKSCILSIFLQDFHELSVTSLEGRFSDPFVFVPEAIGGIILLCFIINLFRHKNLLRFIKTGKLNA